MCCCVEAAAAEAEEEERGAPEGPEGREAAEVEFEEELEFPSAAMTSPKALRLLLIAAASLALSPTAPDLLSLSDPAKSTRDREPHRACPLAWWRPLRARVKTACDLDDAALHLVAAAARAADAQTPDRPA